MSAQPIRFTFVPQSALLARVPDPQNVDGHVDQLVAHFVVADNGAAHLARQLLIQLSATLGTIKQSPWCHCQGLRRAGGGSWIYFSQKVLEPRNIGYGLVGPLQLHRCGEGKGLPVARLAAQASTSA